MIRTIAAAALALALAGCGDGRDPARDPTTQDAAAAGGSAPSPAPLDAPTATASGMPSTAVDSGNATATGTGTGTDAHSAEAAQALVERYYALLGRGDSAAARALWRNGGAASGMDPAAFARSVAGYSRSRASVGAPSRIEAGAGQRYVTVPVTVRGTRKDGSPFAEKGEVTLHRAGDIDGATAEQRSWRIEAIDLAPTAPATADVPNTVTARYRCDDRTTLVAAFDNRADTVTLRDGDRTLGVLAGQRPASGIWYAGDGMTLRGKGEHATFTRDGGHATACTARR